MKVLHIINSLGTGGAEKLLLDTIPIYRKRGIEMDVLLLWNNDHQFTKQLVEMNICKIFIINNSSNVRDIYNPINIFKISKIMRQYPIVHVHLFPAQYFAVIANRLNNSSSKLIFTEHNTSNTRISNKFLKPIDKFFYRDYKKLVCISEEIRQIYGKYLKTNDTELIVISNGIDVEKYNKANALKRSYIHFELQMDDKLIIQVSAFRPQKDQDTLIKCMVLLPGNYKLLLVGDGERKMILMKLVNELGLEKRVFFLGQRMDVPQLLKSADVVVLSSYYEGLSLASVEGMASGKPFIASDVPGLQDIVKEAGILFTRGNEEELAVIIKRLIEDPAYAELTAKKGYNRAMKYDISTLINKHIDMYAQLI
ncbi:glycosyltransferase [Epilithonimonas hungarica]|uniref:Glycosyltransferase involved in cell wall bisynthesis n=1 Tax=Epilithonimonas hungarica TaxID=454006 RepID=A0A1G7GIA6_9FLAO|nr:glycosyltransferase [Epilithonimonas hungarica]SDE87749.1 Glycosyltransferase involved in cell wall bisynthesis [Epilithonimonas hungarica]